MFSGTIRSNLDPIRSLDALPDKGDSLLWDALTKVGLREVIQRLPGGLDSAVAEFGKLCTST
jgi:ABC-type multidrug transport system fused ATPase/permease subunit